MREQVIAWRKADRMADFAESANFQAAWAGRGALMASALISGALVTAMVPAVQAEAASGISSKVVNAFDPIIDLVQGLAYPLCLLMTSGGFLTWMIGQREKGIKMLQSSAIGYVGLQLTPAILGMLVEVGRAMRVGGS